MQHKNTNHNCNTTTAQQQCPRHYVWCNNGNRNTNAAQQQHPQYHTRCNNGNHNTKHGTATMTATACLGSCRDYVCACRLAWKNVVAITLVLIYNHASRCCNPCTSPHICTSPHLHSPDHTSGPRNPPAFASTHFLCCSTPIQV